MVGRRWCWMESGGGDGRSTLVLDGEGRGTEDGGRWTVDGGQCRVCNEVRVKEGHGTELEKYLCESTA